MAFFDPLEFESESESETDSATDDLNISKTVANNLYDQAGELVREDVGDILLSKYQHLLDDKVALVIEEVLSSNPLPYHLQDFQLLALHCLGSRKNVILISPTGSPFRIDSFYGIDANTRKIF